MYFECISLTTRTRCHTKKEHGKGASIKEKGEPSRPSRRRIRYPNPHKIWVSKVCDHNFSQKCPNRVEPSGIDRSRRAAFIPLVICRSSSLPIAAYLKPAAGDDFFGLSTLARNYAFCHKFATCANYKHQTRRHFGLCQKKSDSDMIRTCAGRAQCISSASP